VLGGRAVRLYPIYHPAAALYTPRMLETLREDFARLPELLAMGAPEQPPRIEDQPSLDPSVATPAAGEPPAGDRGAGEPSPPAASPSPGTDPQATDQLGLF
jgi:DNA polymerase